MPKYTGFEQASAPKIEGLFSLVLVYSVVLIPLVVVLGAVFLIVFQGNEKDLPPPDGCSMLGMWNSSNVDDEHDEKYGPGGRESTDQNLRVKSLWIFPVKSCKGIELQRGTVINTGLKYDRQFAFAQLHSPFPVSASDPKSKKADHQWKFITQREFRLLSQIKTEIWIPDPKKPSYSADMHDVKTGGAIILTFPYQEDGWRGMLANFLARIQGAVPEKSFKIPINPTPEQIKRDFSTDEFSIWHDNVKALNMGILVPPELKYFLGVKNPLTLFRRTEERQVFRNAPPKAQLGWQPVAAFSDQYPITLLGISSMQKLSQTQPVGSPNLSIKRFRMNVNVSGSSPYAEDSWKRIRIGSSEYHVTNRCVRCTIPNIDPKTGLKHQKEPFATLRAQREIDQGAIGKGCLGMNMVSVRPEGEIRVGDVVEVLETGEHYYAKAP